MADGASGRKPRDQLGLNLLHLRRLNPERDGASPRVRLGSSYLLLQGREKPECLSQLISPGSAARGGRELWREGPGL